jgi:hypothetical protein
MADSGDLDHWRWRPLAVATTGLAFELVLSPKPKGKRAEPVEGEVASMTGVWRATRLFDMELLHAIRIPAEFSLPH